MSSRRVALASLLFLAAFSPAASAQIRASELATISQTVDGTVITLEYSRPRARGRDAVFGGEVKWNEVWTPGANYATTFDVSRDIKLNQHPVPKGKYSMWMVVRQDKPWILVLDPRARLFHMAHPDSAANQIRFEIDAFPNPTLETLTWSFPVFSPTGATLLLEWANVKVPLDVKVTPSLARTVPADKAKDIVGQYSFEWAEKEASDTAPYTLTITHVNGELVGNWNPQPFPDASPFLLLSKSGDYYFPAFVKNGEIFDVETSLGLQFMRKGGKITGFEARSQTDKLQGTGKRKP